MTTPTFRTVLVPAYAHFSSETLIEGLVGTVSTGLCRTIEEAQRRASVISRGEAFPASQEAPDYQCSAGEMAAARENLNTRTPRDGGLCETAVRDALSAGPNTVAWAIASRYVCAGWV